jgi:biopolymer transport protein ExbD
MRLKRAKTDVPEVAMSPLIDCVFLLLIFFLVTTMLKKTDRDIDVSLPESSSAVKLPPADDVTVIGVNRLGRVFWDGVESTRGQMRDRLRWLATSTPGQRIRVDADADVPIVHVAEILDACQLCGLANVGIRTYDEDYNRGR